MIGSNQAKEPGSSMKNHHPQTAAPTVQPKMEEMTSFAQKPKGGGKQSPVPEVYHVQWAAGTWLIALHLGALFAPWTFTWSGLGLALFMHWVTGSLGIVDPYRSCGSKLASELSIATRHICW
jgi:stearoyl-CoA desaturase (delta-9 desaturase)